MAKHINFDLSSIHQAFDYNPLTGDVVWRVSTGKSKAGNKVGNVTNTGYIRFTYLGKNYSAHRAAWALYYKEQPPSIIDHINGNKLDNRISNLRDGTVYTNQQNQKKAHSRNKTSKYLGVSVFNGRYRAKIYHKGRYIFLGYHETEDQARQAYIEAKRKLHIGCTI